MTAEDLRPAAVLDTGGLESLLALLHDRGYTVIGPTERDGAIVHDELDTSADLPVGRGDEQAPGHYRVVDRDDDAWFGFAATPQSWRRELAPPRLRLWEARRADDGFELTEERPAPPRYAFLGVRSCELAAIEVQDRVLGDSRYPDPYYVAAREAALVIVVQCGSPAGTCFCTSMAAGPRARGGFDLALTEIVDGDRHEFVVETGSARGEELLAALPRRAAGPADAEDAAAVTDRAEAAMGRSMPVDDPRELHGRLLARPDHPRWDDVASRCLACTNCTLVCPTCFCWTVEDVTDLDGSTAVRERRIDSCFTLGHSYLHGGSVRRDIRARYRQWLTHKVDTWYDQFGVSGCVGCGRCIAWCPVGIDLTEEVRALLGEGEAGGVGDRGDDGEERS